MISRDVTSGLMNRFTFLSFARHSLIGAGLLLLSSQGVYAQTAAKKSAEARLTPAQRAERALEAARANPLDLRNFLVRMPKGADLHNHLSGAIYAETWIRDAAEDGLCVDIASHSFVRPQTGARSVNPQPDCDEGKVPVAKAFADQHFYDALIDAFSMRGFVPSAGVSGHDHFFDSFAKFDGTSPRHSGEWLDEIAARAAAQNEQYLELMETPDFIRTAQIAKEVGWRDDLGQLRAEFLAHGLRNIIAVARTARDDAEASRNAIEHCGTPQAAPACKITIRYLYQILRGFPREQVFAQTLLGFEVASVDPRFVGINYVMPEDGRISMADYALHMKIVGFLHGLYPQVHISLHAGEIAPGLVAPEGLCCHIRLAVEEAHAERIGHGVDVMYEDRPYDLLKEMAVKHVMVEINLTSNDVILGVKDKEHPLPIYRKYRVPVALSTDDEGVSRIDLTHEYLRAVESYRLSYQDLKTLARNSLEYSFLSGDSLWSAASPYVPAPACADVAPAAAELPAACRALLAASDKARQQWRLEGELTAFQA